MIRPEKFITSECRTCKRPDWTRKVRYDLLTEEEQSFYGIKSFAGSDVKNLPSYIEKCYATLGSDVTQCIEEGIEIAKLLNKEVAFEFNGVIVRLNKNSIVREIYDSWIHGLCINKAT